MIYKRACLNDKSVSDAKIWRIDTSRFLTNCTDISLRQSRQRLNLSVTRSQDRPLCLCVSDSYSLSAAYQRLGSVLCLRETVSLSNRQFGSAYRPIH